MFRRNAISREIPVHQRQVGGLEPTVAREHVCGPDVISTATVNGAREISAGRSPLAQQVARAVRARRNHVGGVPANCGSGEQVGPSPRLPKPKLAPPRAPRRCAPTNAAAGYSESGMRQAPKRRTSMWPPSTLTTVDGTPPGLMPSSTTMSAERPTSASACGASVAAR